jgi:ribosomal protein S18 acetylase RimI-like enzyme
VLISRKFDEPFFNRAGFIVPEENPFSILAEIESVFAEHGSDSYIFIQNLRRYENLRTIIERRNYSIVDKMSILEVSSFSANINPKVKVDIIEENEIDEWSETYLISFYGETKMLSTVRKIVNKLVQNKDVSLMLAKFQGSPIGTLAIFRSEDINGVYCLGTRPSSRNLGAASTMLRSAYEMSVKEKARFVLQTMLSDSIEEFYLKLGFIKRYTKDFFNRKLYPSL